MKFQKLILLGALVGVSHTALAGITITVEDLFAGGTESKSTAGNSLTLDLSESTILAKYFGVSSQQAISDAGLFLDTASANSSSSNLVATQALVDATTALGGNAAVGITFEFDDYLGPTGLVEWTSAVNAAGINGMFYDAETLVNGNLVMVATNITSSITTEDSLVLDTTLPLTIDHFMRIGATSAGAATALSLDINTTGQEIPLPGSLALVGLGLFGKGYSSVRRRQTAGR